MLLDCSNKLVVSFICIIGVNDKNSMDDARNVKEQRQDAAKQELTHFSAG